MAILIKSTDKRILEAIVAHFENEDHLQEEFLMDRIKRHIFGNPYGGDVYLNIDVDQQKDITIININKRE
jgi:hypothetical protein